MQIQTADALIQALRTSGLFTPEQLLAVVHELTPLGNDLPALVKHLVNHDRLTVYQLRKVIHGKAAELFLGPYVITDKLGEGGMGRVYRARQVRVGREVALKVVRPNLLSNPIIRKRYEREVEAASSLRHPNIVGVEDAGEIDGKVYLALEFVDGIDLARLVREHRSLEVVEACEYARQAAMGLQHAHEAGFVHRDIKPSNIVVAGERHVPQATEPAVVKILDMGLIRAVGFDEGGDVGTDLTRAGTVVGTPDFMAPEQAKNSRTVDHRADLYSLGCTLYYLLLGQPPFATGTPIEKLLKHQLDAPPPLQALRPEIPSEVATVVVRLMAKKPEDRYQTASEVAAVLSPLAIYPSGSQPVPIRVRRGTGAAVVESLPAPGAVPAVPASVDVELVEPAGVAVPGTDSPVQPVAPSDHTPKPADWPGPLHALGDVTSPFASLTEPPSGPFAPVKPPLRSDPKKPRSPGRSVALPVVLAVGTAVTLAVGVWFLWDAARAKPEATPPTNPTQTPPDARTTPPRVPPKSGIVPTVNLGRLHAQHSLVVDRAGLVVVAYPSAYLREKASPFLKGSGPAKLGQWATRLEQETGIPLARTARLALSFPAENPEQYLAVAEGDFVTQSFSDGLAKRFPLANPFVKSERWRLFRLDRGRERHAAVLSPPTGNSLYAVAQGEKPGESLRGRGLSGGKAMPPELDAGMLASLNAATETPLPVLVAVAGGSYKLPFGENSTLKDFGVELLTLKVRIGEKMELELTAVGADEGALKEGLAKLGEAIADAEPQGGELVAEVLAWADRATGEVTDGMHRLTIRAAWTPDQWSAFLEKWVRP